MDSTAAEPSAESSELRSAAIPATDALQECAKVSSENSAKRKTEQGAGSRKTQKRRQDRRSFGRASSTNASSAQQSEASNTEYVDEAKKERAGTKKKVAMLVAYCGATYCGMQNNPGVHTIEGVLAPAVHRAGAIEDFNTDRLQKIAWQRAARTDKYVSALGQVVSAKLIMQEQLVEKINAELPPEIRIFDIKKTTKGFNSKNSCDSRTYEYMVPTYSLVADNSNYFSPTTKLPTESQISSDKEQDEAIAASQQSQSSCMQDVGLEHLRSPPSDSLQITDSQSSHAASTVSFYSECKQSQSYFTKELHERINSLLKLYEGTHNFHNFTSGMEPLHAAAKRFIMKFHCSEPYVVDGVEFVSFLVTGQSFMLHQIRKMVSLVICIARDNAPPESILGALSRDKHLLHKAPGECLILRQCHFDLFYKKMTHVEKLHFDEAKIDQFKKDQVIPAILEAIKEKKVFENWLADLRIYPLQYDKMMASNVVRMAAIKEYRERTAKHLETPNENKANET